MIVKELIYRTISFLHRCYIDGGCFALILIKSRYIINKS